MESFLELVLLCQWGGVVCCWQGRGCLEVLLGLSCVGVVGRDVELPLNCCWERRRVAFELACSTDDQRRVTKQEQANLCAVSVLCAST